MIAILGQPQRLVRLPSKHLYYYQDMKIASVKDKAAEVQ